MTTAVSSMNGNDATKEKGADKGKTYRPSPMNIAYEQKMRDLDARIATAKAKLDDLFAGGSGKGGSAAEREARQKLVDEVKKVREEMRTHQDARRRLIEQATKQREELKRRTGEAQEAKDKLPFRTLPEMEQRVRQLEAQIETGQFKLIEEKAILAEISKLKRARRELESIDASSGDVGSVRLRIDKLRTDIAAKDDVIGGLKGRADEISAKLDAMSGDKQAAQSQRDERQKLIDKTKKEVEELYAQRRAAYEEHKTAKAAQFEARQKRNARNAEFDRRRELEDKLEDLEEKLASFNPETANDRKISECNNLKAFFQDLVGGGASAETAAKDDVSKVEAGVRKVKLSDELAGAVAISKKDNDEDGFFFAPKNAGSGKKQHQQKGSAAHPAFNKLPLHILSGLADLSLSIPASAADVPKLLEAIEKKKAAFASKVDDAAAEKEKQRQAIEEQIAELKKQLDAPVKVKFDKAEGTAVVVDN